MNCYYRNGAIGDSYGMENIKISSVTDSQLASGYVAYMLNGEKTSNVAWYQNIDNNQVKDKVPVLDNSHGIVYRVVNGYSNKPNSTIPTSCVFGDADADNVVTASDAAFVLQKTLVSTFELPIQKKTDDWLKYTDVDCDNFVTASDTAFILQKTLVSTFELPAETKNK